MKYSQTLNKFTQDLRNYIISTFYQRSQVNDINSSFNIYFKHKSAKKLAKNDCFGEIPLKKVNSVVLFKGPSQIDIIQLSECLQGGQIQGKQFSTNNFSLVKIPSINDIATAKKLKLSKKSNKNIFQKTDLKINQTQKLRTKNNLAVNNPINKPQNFKTTNRFQNIKNRGNQYSKPKLQIKDVGKKWTKSENIQKSKNKQNLVNSIVKHKINDSVCPSIKQPLQIQKKLPQVKAVNHLRIKSTKSQVSVCRNKRILSNNTQNGNCSPKTTFKIKKSRF